MVLSLGMGGKNIRYVPDCAWRLKFSLIAQTGKVRTGGNRVSSDLGKFILTKPFTGFLLSNSYNFYNPQKYKGFGMSLADIFWEKPNYFNQYAKQRFYS